MVRLYPALNVAKAVLQNPQKPFGDIPPSRLHGYPDRVPDRLFSRARLIFVHFPDRERAWPNRLDCRR